MTEERRKEIALALVEAQAIEHGIPGTGKGGVHRVAGQVAKSLNDLGFKTDTSEIVELYKSFAPRVISRAFGYQKVNLQMSEPRSSAVPTEPQQ